MKNIALGLSQTSMNLAGKIHQFYFLLRFLLVNSIVCQRVK